jgi:hypothetical protein
MTGNLFQATNKFSKARDENLKSVNSHQRLDRGGMQPRKIPHAKLGSGFRDAPLGSGHIRVPGKVVRHARGKLDPGFVAPYRISRPRFGPRDNFSSIMIMSTVG